MHWIRKQWRNGQTLCQLHCDRGVWQRLQFHGINYLWLHSYYFWCIWKDKIVNFRLGHGTCCCDWHNFRILIVHSGRRNFLKTLIIHEFRLFFYFLYSFFLYYCKKKLGGGLKLPSSSLPTVPVNAANLHRQWFPDTVLCELQLVGRQLGNVCLFRKQQ